MPSTSSGQNDDAATREGQADRGGDADPLGAEGEQVGHQDRCGAADPEGAHRARAGTARTSWASTPATEMVSPEEVDRNAANAPAVTSAASACPSEPPTIRSGSSSTVASVSPVSSRSGA